MDPDNSSSKVPVTLRSAYSFVSETIKTVADKSVLVITLKCDTCDEHHTAPKSATSNFLRHLRVSILMIYIYMYTGYI